MIAVAALSARAIVESAAHDGERCVALDVFGDVDTRRTAARWHAIGDAGMRAIDAERLLHALHGLAREGRTAGWVAGSGFEHQPELLDAGARHLRLLGTRGEDVHRLRDPRQFFGFLQQAGIAYPPVRHEPPTDATGWLQKDAGGSGGAHVRRGAQGPAGPRTYWQRERAAPAMSATYVANGEDATLLGFNRQNTVAFDGLPFVFRGVIGPVAVDGAVQRSVGHAARRLAAHFHLRGLGSVDFLLHGGEAEVIEVNPRPPASLALYPRVGGAGPLRAHRRACAVGELPPATPAAAVRGIEIVYARRPLQLGARAAAALAGLPGTHDLPHAGTIFAAGDPVCSLSAEGPDAGHVQAELTRRHEALLDMLEPDA